MDQDLDIVVSGGFVLSCFLITWDFLRDILLRNGEMNMGISPSNIGFYMVLMGIWLVLCILVSHPWMIVQLCSINGFPFVWMSVEHQLERLWLETVAPWQRKVIFAEKYFFQQAWFILGYAQGIASGEHNSWKVRPPPKKTDVNVGL